MLMTRGELALDMMNGVLPELKGRSHGGGTPDSQAGRLAKTDSANLLSTTIKTTDNQLFVAGVSQNKPCAACGAADKHALSHMSFRSAIYWLACTTTAAIAAGAAEPKITSILLFFPPADHLASSSVLPVPESSRSLFLFAGIMAMAFTYRRAWLDWKSGS
jgi:hypothetical protein